MQFEYHHKAGSEICTIKFIEPVKAKLPTFTALVNVFQRLGAKFPNGTLGTIEFPSFVSSIVIAQIIHNTCYVCGGLMQNTLIPNNIMIKVSENTSKMIEKKLQVRKCSSCGHSHT